MKDSLVICSGGMDSVVLMHFKLDNIALAVRFEYGSNHGKMESMAFNYFAGQREMCQEYVKVYLLSIGIDNIYKAIGIKNKLFSFHGEQAYAHIWGSENLILDSGAFSAYTIGAKIDIDDFICYIKQLTPAQTIQLDVIGNEIGTWKNYLYMREQGVTPLPVIHFNSSVQHIRNVCAIADYICLGALVGKNKNEVYAWLSYVYGLKEMRKKKTHLLGVTDYKLLSKFPCYSCDSSSWLNVVRYGGKTIRSKAVIKAYNATTDKAVRINQSIDILKHEVAKYLVLEFKVTELWAKRGLIFE